MVIISSVKLNQYHSCVWFLQIKSFGNESTNRTFKYRLLGLYNTVFGTPLDLNYNIPIVNNYVSYVIDSVASSPSLRILFIYICVLLN